MLSNIDLPVLGFVYKCHMFHMCYRKQPKNMILAGLWYSNKKPPMQVFLKPVIEDLSNLETTGLCVTSAKCWIVWFTLKFCLQVLKLIPQAKTAISEWQLMLYAAAVISPQGLQSRISFSLMEPLDAAFVNSLVSQFVLKMVVMSEHFHIARVYPRAHWGHHSLAHSVQKWQLKNTPWYVKFSYGTQLSSCSIV